MLGIKPTTIILFQTICASSHFLGVGEVRIVRFSDIEQFQPIGCFDPEAATLFPEGRSVSRRKEFGEGFDLRTSICLW